MASIEKISKCCCFLRSEHGERWANFTVLAVLALIMWAFGVFEAVNVAINPDHCKGPSRILEPGETWLDTWRLTKSKVGYGSLGQGGMLGFEAKCIYIQGLKHSHSLGIHPPAFGFGFATFDISERSVRVSDNQTMNSPSSQRFLRGKVGINDNNNAFGRAGSALMFVVVDDDSGKSLWRSSGIQTTGTYEDLTVDVTYVKFIRLEVTIGFVFLLNNLPS